MVTEIMADSNAEGVAIGWKLSLTSLWHAG